MQTLTWPMHSVCGCRLQLRNLVLLKRSSTHLVERHCPPVRVAPHEARWRFPQQHQIAERGLESRHVPVLEHGGCQEAVLSELGSAALMSLQGMLAWDQNDKNASDLLLALRL